MFDFIRRHTKITMGLLFLLIVPSFILFGLDGYSQSKDNSPTVAKVDGKAILQSEWDKAHLREVDRIKASMPSIDAKLLDSAEARYATLERLVRDRVLVAASAKSKLGISDEKLARELQDNSEIASLRKADGTLDMERYRQLLASQGMTTDMFEANVRGDLSTRQVLAGVTSSGFASKAAAETALNAFFEKREIQLSRFTAVDYASRLTPTDADLEQFYQANAKLFQAPEQASIEYVLFDIESIKKNIVVEPAELKAYYDQNALRLGAKQERRASHILITAAKTAPEAERQKARVKATELAVQVKKAPDTFADVARKNSQDPGSAPAGGDLDFFAREAMVKPFSDAAFAMGKGDISEVVESDFGFHIIKLTDIKEPKQRTFEEMKPELELEVKKQLAQKKFTESAEGFTNAVYEQSDSLKPTADRLKLDVKTAIGVTRKPATGVTGALANTKFLNAIFAPDAIEKKRNTEAVEIGSNQLVSGRITQYTAARTRPIGEVKDDVRQRWIAQRGAEEARKDGIAKLALLKADPAAAALQEKLVVSRDQPQNQPAQIVDAALRADATALPVLAGIDLGAQGYAIVKVVKLLPREKSLEATAKQEQSQYAKWWTSAENLAYYGTLKERFKTEIKVARPVAAKGDQLSAAEAATTQ